jgi:hypothetical protein
MRDLLAQLFADGARIDASRWCGYDGLLGLVLLGGALALRLSGPPDLLGGLGFVLVVACSAVLIAALVVPLIRPRLVPALLAMHGVVIVALTLGFAGACAAWALGEPESRAFRYLPGPIVVGLTSGAALWADFGPARARARRWRLAGALVGLALEAVVAVVVAPAM